MCARRLSLRLDAVQTGNLQVDAEMAFERQRRRRRCELVIQVLTRRRRCLARLDESLGGASLAVRRAIGPREIPLASIVGTVEPSKCGAFDHRFRPPSRSRRRWERLWVAARRGTSLPPIAVYRLGDRHFVADGHHRVSVAHALGMIAIDAEVTELVG